MLSIFLCASWSFVCLPWKNIYSDLLVITRWFLSFFFAIELYEFFILGTLAPCYMICKFFSYSIVCLFILLMVSFDVKKLWFEEVSVAYFCFYYLQFWCQIKKSRLIAKTDVKELTAYVFF